MIGWRRWGRKSCVLLLENYKYTNSISLKKEKNIHLQIAWHEAYHARTLYDYVMVVRVSKTSLYHRSRNAHHFIYFVRNPIAIYIYQSIFLLMLSLVFADHIVVVRPSYPCLLL